MFHIWRNTDFSITDLLPVKESCIHVALFILKEKTQLLKIEILHNSGNLFNVSVNFVKHFPYYAMCIWRALCLSQSGLTHLDIRENKRWLQMRSPCV